mmetsp:Transcript_19389/g.40598  ORF Transcript_19389/g.40598 Transcript_19389/m.40598 type:complete len:327 (-) Transcript_19389:529-1509(-)
MIVFEGEHFVHVHFVDGLRMVDVVLVVAIGVVGVGVGIGVAGVAGVHGSVGMGMHSRGRDGRVGIRDGMARLRGMLLLLLLLLLLLRREMLAQPAIDSLLSDGMAASEGNPRNGLKLRRHHVGPITQKLPHDRTLPRCRDRENAGQPLLRPVARANQQVGLRCRQGGRRVGGRGGGEEFGGHGRAGGDAPSSVVAAAAAAGQGGEHAAEGVVHGEKVDVVSDDGPRLDGLAHRYGVDHVGVVLEEHERGRGDGHDQPVVGVAAAAAALAARVRHGDAGMLYEHFETFWNDNKYNILMTRRMDDTRISNTLNEIDGRRAVENGVMKL